MNPLQQLAKLLGLSEQNAGDSLTSERAARAVLSRRNFFAAGAAMATASAFSFDTRRMTGWVMNYGISFADAATTETFGLVRCDDVLLCGAGDSWYSFRPNGRYRGEYVLVNWTTPSSGVNYLGALPRMPMPGPRCRSGSSTRIQAESS